MTIPTLPIIGITGSLVHNDSGAMVCQVGQAYTTAIQNAGGLPVILPVGFFNRTALPALIDRLDGLMLTGGGDIDPQQFNGSPHPKVYGISPERDELEFALLEKALAVELPLLAICRGIQVLNVAFGGTLHTHIQDQMEQSLKHDWFPKFPRDKLAHTVSITCGSQLDQIYTADEIQVNSLHHQGIARVGEGLEAIAYAPDGLVEAVVVKGAAFALGVQWHPECLPDDPYSQRLFRAFVAACSPTIPGTDFKPH